MLAVTTLGFALAAQAWLFQQTWMIGEGVDPGRPIIGDFAFDTGKQYYFFSLVVLGRRRAGWRATSGRAASAAGCGRCATTRTARARSRSRRRR